MTGEGFKALADPTRRRILELLREGNCTAGELAEHFDISKPSLSHHLATPAPLYPRRRWTMSIDDVLTLLLLVIAAVELGIHIGGRMK